MIFDSKLQNWFESSNWGWSVQPVGKHENEQGQLVNGMRQKCWYPTLLTVPNIEFHAPVGTVPFVVFIKGRLQSNGPAIFTTTFEMFDPRPSIERFYWYSLPTDQQESLGEGYPQLHLISWFPNPLDPTYEEARVVYVGHETPIFAWNPKNPGTPGTTYIWDRRDIPGRVERPNSVSVLLPRMDEMNPTTHKKQAINQVMIVGGFAKDGVNGRRCTARNTAEILDFSNGLDNISRSQINLAETGGRRHPNVVILPDGSLFTLGGIKKFNEESFPCPACEWRVTTLTNDLVLTTERIRYISGSWTSPGFDAGMDGSDRDGECQPGWKTPDGVRIYHSGGILGQNGKVITAGTEMGGSWCDTERCGDPPEPPKVTNRYPTLYAPWYITQERPTILGLPNEQFVEVQNGQTFTLRFQLPLGRALKSVVLMRPGSVTHSMNFDQRMVRCYFDPIPACTDDLTVCQTTVTSPWSCYTAPLGYYLLFVVVCRFSSIRQYREYREFESFPDCRHPRYSRHPRF